MPAAPGIYTLTCYQGATFTQPLTWKAGTPAVAVDMTGYTARMQVRRDYADVESEILLNLTTENGGITLVEEEGRIQLNISSTGTAALPRGNFRYDLEVIAGDATVRRLLQGRFKVKAEVTA